MERSTGLRAPPYGTHPCLTSSRAMGPIVGLLYLPEKSWRISGSKLTSRKYGPAGPDASRSAHRTPGPEQGKDVSAIPRPSEIIAPRGSLTMPVFLLQPPILSGVSGVKICNEWLG